MTRQVSAGTRVYYMDARKDTQGNAYLTVTEVPTSDKRQREKRERVFVHREHLEAFIKALGEVAAEILSEPETPETPETSVNVKV